MECSQCGRGQTVTHRLRGRGLGGPTGQRLHQDPPGTAAPPALQVPDTGSGRGTRPPSQHCGSLRHASVSARLTSLTRRLEEAVGEGTSWRACAFLSGMKRRISWISREPLPFSLPPGGVTLAVATRPT